MNGQLWQPCSKCDNEPVCVDCELCERHCRCAADAAERAEIREIQQSHPGFLADLVRHLEQGGQEY